LLVTLTDLFDGGVGDVDGCLRHFVRVVGSLLLALYLIYRIIFISIFCWVEIEMRGKIKMETCIGKIHNGVYVM
jgi:hypothetical protein